MQRRLGCASWRIQPSRHKESRAVSLSADRPLSRRVQISDLRTREILRAQAMSVPFASLFASQLAFE